MKSLTLAEVAAFLQCPSPTQPNRRITGVNTLDDATEDELSFLGSNAFRRQFRATRALAVIVQRKVKVPPDNVKPLFMVDDADLAVAKLLELMAPPVPRPSTGVDRLARVDATASVDPTAAIGPFVFVGPRTVIGPRVILHPGVYVGDDASVGEDSVLFPNVVVRERITVGRRVIIHAGSVLGTDGFGYRWDGQKHAKIPQIGRVVIEDDVEIGSCTCIDRAKFSETRVGAGTKIDNLVQIGHNVRTGPHCMIVGQAGLAGSVTLGRNVVLGGQAAVRDHVTLGDGVMAAACSAVATNTEPKMVVSGVPALPHRQHLREQAALRHLPDLVVQMRRMKEEVRQLKEKLGKSEKS